MTDSSANPPRPESEGEDAAEAADSETFIPPEFEPSRPRPRFDGWTARRQEAFIQALAEGGCVADACRAVGMSQRSAYALRARADAVSFRNAWDTALDFAMRRLSDAVLSRAINGVAVPVFFQGAQIGEKRHFNDRLAMFLLRYRDPIRYGKWLDRAEHRGHPEGQASALAEARLSVREDADLPADEVPDRVSWRLGELAMKMRIYNGEYEGEDENEGDVPRTS